MILELIEEAQIGKIYLGKVKRVEPYGAFIEILPGIDVCFIFRRSRLPRARTSRMN